MESQPDPLHPRAAQEQLRAARQAHDASVRRATVPPSAILAVSVFCGVQTVAPAYQGPGRLAAIVAVVGLIAALLNLSARGQWKSLLSSPKPQWGVAEVTLICVAVLVGAVIGPHLLADHGNSALAGWGLGAAVAVIVAVGLCAANAAYRRRSSRAWEP